MNDSNRKTEKGPLEAQSRKRPDEKPTLFKCGTWREITLHVSFSGASDNHLGEGYNRTHVS